MKEELKTMDYNKLADILFPEITKTPADYEAMYPPRDLPVESLSMTLPVGGGEFVRAGWRKTPSGELVEELSLPPGWRRLGE